MWDVWEIKKDGREILFYPDMKATSKKKAEEKANALWGEKTDKLVVILSPEQEYLDDLFEKYVVKSIEINGGCAVRRAVVKVVNNRRSFGYDIIIVTYNRRSKAKTASDFTTKSVLRVKDLSRPYYYQINGQPDTNTAYYKLKK